MKFFYQLKAVNGNGWHDSTLLYTGFIEAPDKKIAKQKMNDEFQMKLQERFIIKEGKKSPEYKLYLVPSDPGVTDFYLTDRKCQTCGDCYKILEQRNLGHYASKEVCSHECRAHNRPPPPEHLEDFSYGNHKPTIYKVTNKKSGQCYIGQTIRPVTLRWWEHFFHPSENKFHKAIKDSSITEWTFEVLEILETKEKKAINSREQFWIDHHDSVENGYNSATVVASKEPEILPLFEAAE